MDERIAASTPRKFAQACSAVGCFIAKAIERIIVAMACRMQMAVTDSAVR